MCMYAKLIEHNLVGQPEIRKANFGGDHTPYVSEKSRWECWEFNWSHVHEVISWVR